MALIEDGTNANRDLNPDDYTASGELKTLEADKQLVVGSAMKAEDYINNKQWSLMWRDADLLFQAPRPMTTYENTYILEPNVQRFTVAKICNAVVPQIYKGLFYEDPPLVIRPRPGTKQSVTDAKTAMFSYLLDACKFRRETKWGIEQMAHLGTGIWKWGIEYVEVEKTTREATTLQMTAGPDGGQVTSNVPLDNPPKIKVTKKIVPRPFFEHRPIDMVLVDPKTRVGDIQEADYAVDVRYMNFYQLKNLKDSIDSLDDSDADKNNWHLPKSDAELQSWWLVPTQNNVAAPLSVDQAIYVKGIVNHAEDINAVVSPDRLFDRLEVLEYWDRNRKILVIDRKKVIFSGENKFKRLPFLSANWWNRPKAFYGMGLGLIVGQNQRVDQGTINAILKILSFGINPIYLRQRDSNNLTQMIRTGIGKILTVDNVPKDAYHLLETPKVPSDVWSALQESEKSTESSSGADQALVQGSTAGPRNGMGRTAGGAGILASASATRLDGPLDNFIEQVFKPFLYILDELIRDYMSDKEIFEILGEELGSDFEMDFQEYHSAIMDYEVLAGSSLAAKRTMAQSMTLITQIFENPTIQQNLAEINGEYIDFKPILKMWMESTEWKNVNDIIKPLTPAMKQRMEQKSEAAQAQSKANVAAQQNDQKFKQKQALQAQQADDRIKKDIVVNAFRNNSMTEATEGEASAGGVEGGEPNV